MDDALSNWRESFFMSREMHSMRSSTGEGCSSSAAGQVVTHVVNIIATSGRRDKRMGIRLELAQPAVKKPVLGRKPRVSLLLCLLLQGGEDGFGGLAVGEGAGVDAEGGGFLVEGFSGAVEFLDGAAGGGGLEQGAFAVFDALVEMIRAGVEPDDGTDLREKFSVLLGGDDAAAGGDDEADASD